MKKDLGKEALEKEAAFWEAVKTVLANPGQACRK